MPFTSVLRQLINSILKYGGLKVQTLREENREAARIARMEANGRFEREVFPIPQCITESDWRSLLPVVRTYRERLQEIYAGNNVTGFVNENSYFHSPDSDVLYSLIRHLQPSTIIEIGSGNSTRIARQAIVDESLATRIVAIDPNPRTDVHHCADDIRKVFVEECSPVELAGELKKSDFLFIDSSHELAVGNDCIFEFLELIPRLSAGVYIHVHDVSLPWEYPCEWARREPCVRRWGEQYLLQALICMSDRFEVIWPGYLVQQTLRSDFRRLFPECNGRDATSFWMVTR